jgi:hypothetical protein
MRRNLPMADVVCNLALRPNWNCGNIALFALHATAAIIATAEKKICISCNSIENRRFPLAMDVYYPKAVVWKASQIQIILPHHFIVANFMLYL